MTFFIAPLLEFNCTSTPHMFSQPQPNLPLSSDATQIRTATAVLPIATAPITQPAPILCPLLVFGFEGPEEVEPLPEDPSTGAEEDAAAADDEEEGIMVDTDAAVDVDESWRGCEELV